MVVTKFARKIDPATITLTRIGSDWFGEPIDPAAAYGFAIDPGHFHFRATRTAPARPHPDARPGAFTSELWMYDCAEFFIVDAETDRYLEFNLAPNGAWWSCEFGAPRQRSQADDVPFPGVVTTGSIRDDHWEATASLPLKALQELLHFGPGSRLNATFTLDPPDQRFLTATPLGPGTPDFHQPSRLPLINIQSIDIQQVNN